MNTWNSKNILCIRPDNMGDVLMAEPAIRALKESFQDAKITLLTSSFGAPITKFMPEIDETIVFDLPFVKTEKKSTGEELEGLIEKIKEKRFDGSVVFTNYSQTAAPSVVLCYLAGIKNILAYSRENVYGLLTHWVKDTQPFTPITHGVRRNLDLVSSIGAQTSDEGIRVSISSEARKSAFRILDGEKVDLAKPWIVIHPGIRDDLKRQYPLSYFAEIGRKLRDLGYQIVVSGTDKERVEVEKLVRAIGYRAFLLAGKLDLEEFIALIEASPLLISGNTGVVHIAAAVHTPTVVIYARTNPEHTPWRTRSEVLFYDVEEKLRNKTPILYYSVPDRKVPMPTPEKVVAAALRILGVGETENDQGGGMVWI